MTIDLNALRDRVHAANVARGWWRDKDGNCTRGKRSVPTALCLIHSEVSEGMEGDRKSLMDDKLPHRSMLEVELADTAIRALDLAGGYDVELPSPEDHAETVALHLIVLDAAGPEVGDKLAMLHFTISAALKAYMEGTLLIGPMLAHIEALAKDLGLDLYGAIEEKLAVNATRADHDPAERAKIGGKAY